MIVRPALLADLNACYDMDKAYVTDYVWQMQCREGERSIEVHFDTVRLPRSMKVDYPRHADELLPNWRQEECFLVAEEDGQVVGFVDVMVQAWNRAGWIRNLVVERQYRRSGVATSLLRYVRSWILENDLSRIMLEAQTKNYPAICFAHKQGFVFCGYHDRYYLNGDIAVFFSSTA